MDLTSCTRRSILDFFSAIVTADTVQEQLGHLHAKDLRHDPQIPVLEHCEDGQIVVLSSEATR
jgi:uncharacterized membrane protein